MQQKSDPCSTILVLNSDAAFEYRKNYSNQSLANSFGLFKTLLFIFKIVGSYSPPAPLPLFRGACKFRTVKNLPRVGRPKKTKTPRHEQSLFRVLRSSRFEPLHNIVLACKKTLTFEALAKSTVRKIIKKQSFLKPHKKKILIDSKS